MEKQLKSPFQSKPRIRLCRHNHQEPTVKVVLIKSPSRYISFSKEGRVLNVKSFPNITKNIHFNIELRKEKNFYQTLITSFFSDG